MRKENLVVAPASNGAQNVDRSTTCHQQVMTSAREAGHVRSKRSSPGIAVACVEVFERALKSIEIRSIARVNDIEVECRQRHTTDDRSYTAHHDQFDVVPGEDLKGVFESRWAVQVQTR